MTSDAEGSRTEPGCVRFEALKGSGDDEHWFDEQYRNAAASEEHRQQPHFNACVAFKESDGVVAIEGESSQTHLRVLKKV